MVVNFSKNLSPDFKGVQIECTIIVEYFNKEDERHQLAVERYTKYKKGGKNKSASIASRTLSDVSDLENSMIEVDSGDRAQSMNTSMYNLNIG